MNRAVVPRSIFLIGPPNARGFVFRVGSEWIVTVGHDLSRTPNHRNPGEDLVLVEVTPFDGSGKAVAKPEVFDCILDVAVLGDPRIGEIQIAGCDWLL